MPKFFLSMNPHELSAYCVLVAVLNIITHLILTTTNDINSSIIYILMRKLRHNLVQPHKAIIVSVQVILKPSSLIPEPLFFITTLMA